LRCLLLPTAGLFSFWAQTAFGLDLCDEGQIYFEKSKGQLTVHFREYYPIKLKTIENCDVTATCLYDIAFVSGDKTGVQHQGLQIKNLCGSANERKTPFMSHEVSEYSPPLRKVYEYSREMRIVFAEDWGNLSVSRTDYSHSSDNIGWLSPLLEDGGSWLQAGAGASTFRVAIRIEEQ